jgi:hypothetical protein
MYLKKVLLSLAVLGTSSVYAQGIVLNHEDLRSDLNWLNQQGVIQLSTSTWPLSGDEVVRALSQAKITHPAQEKVLLAVQQHLNRENQLIQANAFYETDRKDLPQSFGDSNKAQFVAGAELNVGGAQWDARLRINVENDQQIDNDQEINIEGSYVAGKLWNQWLIAGQIPTYWGPAHDGSLIRGDASRPVYGFTLQRAEQTAFESKWLSWIGPWQYQAFAGQLDDYKAIPDTKILGLRLTAQPLEYLEVGASRAFQWGGEGRSESLSSLWDAIKGNDNVYDSSLDRSNQLAGIDMRLNLNSLINVPMSLYGSFVGEDESGFIPSRKLYTAGADYSSAIGKMPYQLYMEWSDTRTNRQVRGYTYNHYVYTDGFYQHGFPLAHAIGGDSEMISLGGQLHVDIMNRISGRVLIADLNQSNLSINHAFPQSDEIMALDMTWTHYLNKEVPLKLNAWIVDSDRYGQDAGASIGIELPLTKGIFR